MKIQISAILSLLLGAGLFSENALGQAERPERANASQRTDFFKKMDSNGDGALSKEEAPSAIWERLSAKDANQDGKVTVQELRAKNSTGGSSNEQNSPGARNRSFDLAALIDRADRNKDGKVSKDEVPAQAWERLAKMDANQDGAVSKKEAEAISNRMQSGQAYRGNNGRPQGPASILNSFDADKDGSLTESEVSAGMWAKISRLDEDENESISLSELQTAWK